MQLTLEQIRELAPDEKSVAAAEQLLLPRLWENAGVSQHGLWAICAGGRNFQVKVDLANFGYHCTCPSRKFPCKHVLAMLTMFANMPDLFQAISEPIWVRTWIEKRRQREFNAAQRAKKKEKPLDAEAQAKRIAEREKKVASGIEQLSLWLDDILRQGIATLETKPFSFWDDQARRLIDAQAKGLSGRIRNIGESVGTTSDWPTRVTQELGKLRLLLHAYLNQDQLSESLRWDVRQLIGWTVSQAELETHGDKVTDDWFICSQRVEEDERLRTQRSWAIGLNSNRKALLLQFAPGRQGFPEQYDLGKSLRGELLFYPGTVPQRAKLVQRKESETNPKITGEKRIQRLLEYFAQSLGKNPWLNSIPCLLCEITLTRQNSVWFIRDETGAGLPCQLNSPYEILSVTGGQPFQLFGEWNGYQLQVDSYWSPCEGGQFRHT